MSAPVTVVIPTLDEATQIGACVRSVAWAGEIIVADAQSQDGTAERARQAGATVLTGTWPTIAAQRNAAIAEAGQPWVLALDADERIGPELAAEIAAVVARPRHDAYALRRRNFYLGREVRRAGWGADWVFRLFRRERRFVERRVHEALERVADAGRLTHPLSHHPYRDFAHHLRKVDRYARWAAADLADAGRPARVVDLLFRPPARFLRMYALQLGMLEGWRGALLCGVAAWGVFLKYALLWELHRNEPEDFSPDR